MQVSEGASGVMCGVKGKSRRIYKGQCACIIDFC